MFIACIAGGIVFVRVKVLAAKLPYILTLCRAKKHG